MPIKQDYNVDPKWFIDHTPIDLTGVVLAENIEDMISYSVEARSPETPVTMDYHLGAVFVGKVLQLVLRNLTENSTLQVSVRANKTSLKVLDDNGAIANRAELFLGRGETKSVTLFLNTEYLDSVAGELEVDTGMNIIVTHTANTEVIKKDQNIVPLQQTVIRTVNLT